MLGVVFAVAAVTIAANPYRGGIDEGREALLVDPAPHAATRVDSPDRLENGRLWISRGHVSSRTPVSEMRYGAPGAAWRGASYDSNYEVAYVRVGMQAIAIDPFARYDDEGMQHFRRASNLWLREQGYVQSVRTHVNPRYYVMEESDAYAMAETAGSDLPQPRATIRMQAPKNETPKRLRASIKLREGDRLVKPDIAPVTGPPISYDEWLASTDAKNPAEATIAEVDEQDEAPDA